MALASGTRLKISLWQRLVCRRQAAAWTLEADVSSVTLKIGIITMKPPVLPRGME